MVTIEVVVATSDRGEKARTFVKRNKNSVNNYVWSKVDDGTIHKFRINDAGIMQAVVDLTDQAMSVAIFVNGQPVNMNLLK